MEPITPVIQKKTPWGAILGIGIPIFFVCCFFALIIGGVLGRVLFPKVVVIEKVISQKDPYKYDKDTKNETTPKNDQQDFSKKNESAGLSGYMIQNPKTQALLPIPTEMSGNFGICWMNGKLRMFIKSDILDDYKKNGITQKMRGTPTGWKNVDITIESEYSYVEGTFTTDAQEDGSMSVVFCIESWPKDGHLPHLLINDGYTSPYFVGNDHVGYNFVYPIVEVKPS